jgi:molybdate transport system ATP-binding protein
MREPSLKQNRLGVRYRLAREQFSLDVDISLPMQGISGIYGPSGAGKTTLLRCMAGLEHSDSGRLDVDGETWEDSDRSIDLASHHRQIGYVFQEARLFGHMSVAANLEYGMKRTRAVAADFDEIVSLLGLEDFLARMPMTLSGGEAQRVAIGRALLRAPRMILMDEPLASLDEARKEEVLPFLERLHASLKTPLLYVSHNIDEICRLCDHLVVMQSGRILAQGDLQSVLLNTDLPVLAGKEAGAVLIGRIKDYDSRFDLTQVDVAGSGLRVPGEFGPAGTELRIRVRANDVSVCLEKPERSSILNVIMAQIERVQEESGASTLLHLRAGGECILARVTRLSASELALQPGDSVFAQIKSIAVRNSFATVATGDINDNFA